MYTYKTFTENWN